MSNKKVKMLRDGVLVEEITNDEETESGIITPKSEEEAMRGEVKSVGKGVVGNLKVGDRIIFKGKRDPVNVGNNKYLFLRENQILAVLE